MLAKHVFMRRHVGVGYFIIKRNRIGFGTQYLLNNTIVVNTKAVGSFTGIDQSCMAYTFGKTQYTGAGFITLFGI